MNSQRNKTRLTSEAEKDARELIEQIVQQEPRLKAAHNARKHQVAVSSVAKSLQTFRHQLKT